MSTLRSAYLDVPEPLSPPPAQAGARVHKWTYEEYVRLDEIGVLPERRFELIEGRIIEMAPVGPRHFVANCLVDAAIRRICPAGHFVPPAPVLKLGGSGPLPDAAMIRGRVQDYTGSVPTTAALIIEVSDSTLAPDRLDKASLYAKSGISDYWIVNLVDDVVEVHRNPVLDPSQPSGFRYANVDVFRAGDAVSPLVAPGASVAVSELLP